MSGTCKVCSIHLSIVCNRFIPFMGSWAFLLQPIPAVSGPGQGTACTSLQLIAGPQDVLIFINQWKDRKDGCSHCYTGIRADKVVKWKIVRPSKRKQDRWAVNLTKTNSGLHLYMPSSIPCQSNLVATSFLSFFPFCQS